MTLNFIEVDRLNRTGTSINKPLPLMLPVFPMAFFWLPLGLSQWISTGSSMGIRLLVRRWFDFVITPPVGQTRPE